MTGQQLWFQQDSWDDADDPYGPTGWVEPRTSQGFRMLCLELSESSCWVIQLQRGHGSVQRFPPQAL